MSASRFERSQSGSVSHLSTCAVCCTTEFPTYSALHSAANHTLTGINIIGFHWDCNMTEPAYYIHALSVRLRTCAGIVLICVPINLMETVPLYFGTEIYIYAFSSIIQQKSLITTNYNLVNTWRHVSAVLTATFRPTCSTGQVQIMRVRCTTSWPEGGCKHSRNMSPCIN
jgi:hypothetical protein